VVGAYLVNRFANGRHAINRAQDIVKFALLAGAISTTISATLGVISLLRRSPPRDGHRTERCG
jgi:integral membrane sensor domain MASE1